MSYDAAAYDRRRLDLARRTLIEVGYFTEEQVGDDIAPRISELVFAIRDGKFDPTTAFKGKDGVRVEGSVRGHPHGVSQVVMTDDMFKQFEGWLRLRRFFLFLMPPAPGELPTYGIGVDRDLWEQSAATYDEGEPR